MITETTPLRGVLIVTSEAGQVRSEYKARLSAVLGEPILRTYDQGRRLPKHLRQCRYVVLISDVAEHIQDEQIQSRKVEGCTFLRISRKWAFAEASLRKQLPHVIGAEEQVHSLRWSAASAQDKSKPAIDMLSFHRLLVRDLGFVLSKFDLAFLRHAEGVATPLAGAASFDSVLALYRRALREALGDKGTTLPKKRGVSDETLLEFARGVERRFSVAPADPIVQARVRAVGHWADILRRTGRRLPSGIGPLDLLRAVQTVQGLPYGFSRNECTEIFSLLEGSEGPAGSMGLDEAISILQGVLKRDGQGAAEVPQVLPEEPQAEPEVDAVLPAPPVEEDVAAPPVEKVVVALPPAPADWIPGSEPFVTALLRIHPKMSLADCAWLRQQTEVWAVRQASCTEYQVLWAWATGTQRSVSAGRLRQEQDEVLLETAYTLLASVPSMPESEAVTQRLAVVQRLANVFRSERCTLRPTKRTEDVIKQASSSLLEWSDVEEALDLAEAERMWPDLSGKLGWVEMLTRAIQGGGTIPTDARVGKVKGTVEPLKMAPVVLQASPAAAAAVLRKVEGLSRSELEAEVEALRRLVIERLACFNMVSVTFHRDGRSEVKWTEQVVVQEERSATFGLSP